MVPSSNAPETDAGGTTCDASPASAGLVSRLDSLRLRADDIRVREHLRRTEATLRDVDTDHLTAAQRTCRRRHLDELRTYWERGTFPRNRTVTGRTPWFVDSTGTDCAVGHLLRRDGEGELVDAVAETAPTIRIEALDAGASQDAADVDAGLTDELTGWFDRNGFSREEAARIQPTYGESVEFATTCGPVSCRLAAVLSGLVATAFCAGVEYLGYRLAGDLFPTNALKRRVALFYFTALTVVALPLLALLLYALFP